MKTIRSPRARTSFFCSLLFLSGVFNATGIQCFSCKGSSSNEIEANAQCLETANVEDCNDFYLYYSQVDSRHPASPTDDDDDDDDFEYSYDAETPSAAIEKTPQPTKAEEVGGTRRRNRRSNAEARVTSEELSDGEGRGGGGEDPVARNASDETEKLKLPTDPEHHCYSSTKKMAWESYVVEKGCKRIVDCRAHEANIPDWSMPWNFCCDKSRCNAKLVRDKPQRIFGMGCRRTDDCIQGHNTRHVCPDMFQSCPKVSTNVIKMECRTRNQRLQNSGRSSVAYHAYFHQSKEKKCFCSKGYYPKGPICTSKGFIFQQSIAAILCPVLLIFQALT